MTKLISFLSANIWVLAGIVAGAISGYLYWYFIGCTSGSCALSSVWHNSVMYWAFVGGIAGSMVRTGRNSE